MLRATLFVLLTGAIVASSGALTGQDGKKAEPKQKDDAPARVKGFLPPHFKKLGLSESQVQDIYKIQNKYGAEMDALETKIRELKGVRDKEVRSVLTAEQKKRLEDILTGKEK